MTLQANEFKRSFQPFMSDRKSVWRLKEIIMNNIEKYSILNVVFLKFNQSWSLVV